MGHKNLPVTNTKAMEICELPNKEFKIAVLRKLSELPEDTERQFKKIRKTMVKEYKREAKSLQTSENGNSQILNQSICEQFYSFSMYLSIMILSFSLYTL